LSSGPATRPDTPRQAGRQGLSLRSRLVKLTVPRRHVPTVGGVVHDRGADRNLGEGVIHIRIRPARWPHHTHLRQRRHASAHPVVLPPVRVRRAHCGQEPNFYSSITQLVAKQGEIAIRGRLWCKMAGLRESSGLQQLELVGFFSVDGLLAPQQPQNSDFPSDFSELPNRTVEVGPETRSRLKTYDLQSADSNYRLL
jgi:hypothetical protein